MDLPLLAAPALADYGPLGAIAGSLLALFVWYVRATRRDSLGATARAEAALTAFTRYVQETSARQTEALVHAATGLQEVATRQDRAENRAQARHEELLRAFRAEANARRVAR